mgnify:CR=1 FL=1
MSGGGRSRSTTTPMIPNELKPLANLYTQQATQLANTPFQAYTGQRYAGLDPMQSQAMQMVQNRATQGSQTIGNAEGALNSMIQGGQSNPYLDQLVGKAQKSVADTYNSTVRPSQLTAMVNSGSFGNSGLVADQQRADSQLQQNLGDIATSMYGGAYETDAQRRMQAIGMAPTFGNQAYQDAGQLLNVGNLGQQQQQNNLDFAYQQFSDAQNDPYKKLQAIGGVLGQNMGSTTVQKGGGK